MDMLAHCTNEWVAPLLLDYLPNITGVLGVAAFLFKGGSSQGRSLGTVLLVCAISLYGVAYLIPKIDPQTSKIDHWTVLAIVVGLGAYTSTLLLELRKSIAGATRKIEEATNNKSKAEKLHESSPSLHSETIILLYARQIERGKEHREKDKMDLAWLLPTDVLLMMSGVLVMGSIVNAEVQGCEPYRLQALIIGLVTALIVYMVILHLRQHFLYWWKGTTIEP